MASVNKKNKLVNSWNCPGILKNKGSRKKRVCFFTASMTKKLNVVKEEE